MGGRIARGKGQRRERKEGRGPSKTRGRGEESCFLALRREDARAYSVRTVIIIVNFSSLTTFRNSLNKISLKIYTTY